MKTIKKIVSCFLALSMLLVFVPASAPADASEAPAENAADAPPAKDGYTLAPVLYGKTGVDVSSAFLLTAPKKASIGEIAAALSIDGQPSPEIEQSGEDEKEFLVTPAEKLSHNSLYIFRLKRSGKDDITWAFQTAAKFQITSGFPRNQATNVPKDSGVEITFSAEGYGPIDDYFEISPNVEGSFEYHKNTAVFVPKSLAYKTLYTVTIKAGIGLEGTNEAIGEDYEFSFETEAEPTYEAPKHYESIYFYSSYVELPTIEPPEVGLGIYHSYGSRLPNPKITVYKFGDIEKAVEAVELLTGAPSWSRYAKDESFVDTYGLGRVMSFEASGNYDEGMNRLSLPDKLSQGFYLIDAKLENSRDQMIVQISDLPVQVVADGDKAIFWVNDIETKKPSGGASVRDVKNGRTYKTDADGVAVVERPVAASHDQERFEITSADGKTCLWLYRGWRYGSMNAAEAYWAVLQLDRSLFKSDDSVSFFSFVQHREKSEEIKTVTAVLTQGYSYGYYGARDILQKQAVSVKNGVYSDEIKLPNLDSGSYALTIYHGDIALASTYFSVRDYVKPPYKIEVAADKKAAFAGDTVSFTTKAGFFEGTPVADLDLSYRFSGYYLENHRNGEAKTDRDGIVEISEKIVPEADAQGQASLYFSVEATLPEIGMTQKGASVRVFVNDIEVDAKATRKGGDASLSVNVNSISLDRINGGTAEHYYDYLGAPVANKSLSAEIFRVHYEKIETGQYYDYIEKKTRPTYRYQRMEELIERFELVTDKDGAAQKNFTVPDRQHESYIAKLSCVDGNGRKITHTRYIGRDYSDYWYNASSNNYFLDGGDDLYDVGDEVALTLKRGADTVEKGNFLFVSMQRGIQSWQAGNNPCSFEFSKEHIPNVTVYAYYFNGYAYQSHNYYMNKTICFDYSKNDLTLTAATDKETYKPGDMCSITITAKDMGGNPKEASVNISAVDEALFALRDYSVDTLYSLYHRIGSGLKFSAATHRTYMASLEFDDEMAEEAPAPEASAPSEQQTNGGGGGGDDAYLREIFRDTAFFGTVSTNKQGEATYAFKLPDNITSWRLTLSGISVDLYAGNKTQNIAVTNPMFLSYSINNEFLVGDIPAIGVNAYGTSLSGGETIEFEVWDERRPELKYKASGVAFERVNIPLWEMKNEGANSLVVKATAQNGTSDAVRHTYQVLSTYREIDEAAYFEVGLDTVFEVGSGGLADITFADQGRGAFLYQLISLRRGAYGGDRIEKMLAHREADKLIKEYFPDVYLSYCKIDFDPKRYQQASGGISILPHAEADLGTTVKLMPYIADEIDKNSLKNYLRGIYGGDGAENKMRALYGLAMLKEPVLLDLGNYALQDDLLEIDALYIALGYLALGEKQAASQLYDEKIAPKLEHVAPYFRLNAGEDQDDVLEATSAAGMLATILEKPEKDGLYQYCIKNRATDILTNIEKLSHIEKEISKRTDARASIKYTLFGEEFTRDLGRGGSYTLRIPAQNMDSFKLVEVNGSVGAVSVFKKPMAEIGEIDRDVSVQRRYYEANEYQNSSYSFKQGDLVRVHIWIDYSKKSIDGSYSVTDYLPAGLEYVSGSAKIGNSPDFGYGHSRYCTVEGQKVTFYDYNGKFDRKRLYYYYARVISPGSFKAEGPLVQNLAAKTLFTLGGDVVVTIE